MKIQTTACRAKYLLDRWGGDSAMWCGWPRSRQGSSSRCIERCHCSHLKTKIVMKNKKNLLKKKRKSKNWKAHSIAIYICMWKIQCNNPKNFQKTSTHTASDKTETWIQLLCPGKQEQFIIRHPISNWFQKQKETLCWNKINCAQVEKCKKIKMVYIEDGL